jgi:hypothetical protein
MTQNLLFNAVRETGDNGASQENATSSTGSLCLCVSVSLCLCVSRWYSFELGPVHFTMFDTDASLCLCLCDVLVLVSHINFCARCVSRFHSTAGPFNSIPRMPQMTTNRDPEQKIASYYPAWNHLTRNFIIANYHSDDGMDHDGVYLNLFLWRTRPFLFKRP